MKTNFAAVVDKLETEPLITEKCDGCRECAEDESCNIFRSPIHENKKEGGCRCFKKEPHAEKLL